MSKIDLEKALMQLCSRNKDGSYSTQAARRAILSLAARDLREMGVYNLAPAGLKPRHVERLIHKWRDKDGLSAGTLKNRLSHLRWWAEKVGKRNVIPRDNTALGIERRHYVAKESKALQVGPARLDHVQDERLRASIELQRVFGLRREECLKFRPSFAIRGDVSTVDRIYLKDTWCKGGRPREVPVRNEAQRAALRQAMKLAGGGSMIPPDKKYVQQLKRYEWAVQSAGMSKLHGLRHEYAQRRYLELTGWKAPAAGGPSVKALTPDQKAKDRSVRLTISQELGHNREAITAVYLGR